MNLRQGAEQGHRRSIDYAAIAMDALDEAIATAIELAGMPAISLGACLTAAILKYPLAIIFNDTPTVIEPDRERRAGLARRGAKPRSHG
ncbi:hypothetical protein [Ciceribacter thiooxidans]|uniref:Uncharacterized protein n=1 Tax=Ciceribacter thiooxidans TaxID=1969821 RepID=A0ABV7HWT8_9HYPH|nr:hypothetical protein [Ciceribacter thiooxidans]